MVYYNNTCVAFDAVGVAKFPSKQDAPHQVRTEKHQNRRIIFPISRIIPSAVSFFGNMALQNNRTLKMG